MKLLRKHLYIIGAKPQTDWRRVLITALLLAIAVSVYGIIFYHTVSKTTSDIDVAALSPSASNATTTAQASVNGGPLELNQIIELYLKKKDTFNKMVNELKKS
jgi:uncharacterized protein YpmS